MSQAVVVRKVESSADYKAFFEFPWTLYKDDPNWVPPLLSVRKALLDKSKKSAAWEYLDGEYFTAWRGGKIVGTIAAIINHRHNEFNDEQIGWFGAFEVYDDQEAATALLEQAAQWVKSQGYHAIRGPQNFTTHEETGLLIENFSQPVILMPYNFPYYQQLIENAGFEKVMDIKCVLADRASVDSAGTANRLEKLVQRASKRSNITVRPINRKKLKEEFELFKKLYNEAWDQNWSFVPMTERELDELVNSLGQFFDPSLAFFAEVDGEPAGFVLCIPDFNDVLRHAYPRPGVPEIWTLLRALWFWKVKKVIRGARMPLLGVKREFRNKGVDLALYHRTLNTFYPLQYEFLDSGWVLETNDLLKICKNMGMDTYKTHRYYEKPIEK